MTAEAELETLDVHFRWKTDRAYFDLDGSLEFLHEAATWIRDIEVSSWPEGCVGVDVLLGGGRYVTITPDTPFSDVWDLGATYDQRLGRGIPLWAMRYMNVSLQACFDLDSVTKHTELEDIAVCDEDADPLLVWDDEHGESRLMQPVKVVHRDKITYSATELPTVTLKIDRSAPPLHTYLEVHCKNQVRVPEDDFQHERLGPKLERVRRLSDDTWLALFHNVAYFTGNMVGLQYAV